MDEITAAELVANIKKIQENIEEVSEQSYLDYADANRAIEKIQEEGEEDVGHTLKKYRNYMIIVVVYKKK